MSKIRATAILVMLMFILTSISPVVTCASSINDVTGHWAEVQINDLIRKGIINGYPDGSFKTEGKITRAEFASIIVKGFNLSGGSGKIFADTAEHWGKESIAIANHYGIVNGYSETTFGPNDPITREQMSLMAVKAANLSQPISTKKFADSQQISDWAKDAVALAAGNGIISGYPDNSFKPKGNSTRAEAALVLNRSISILETEQTVEIDYTSIEKAGTYGPATGTKTISDNVTVKAKDTILQNLVIVGDLIIAKEVGDGDVTLNNIKVEGKTYIRGGGKDSIHIKGGNYREIIIEKTVTGALRIVAIDSKGLQITVAKEAYDDEIIINGDIEKVTVKADNIKVITQGKTQIAVINAQSGLKNLNIELSKDSNVQKMVLNSKVSVKGQGTTDIASGNKIQTSTFETPPRIFETPPRIIDIPSTGGGGYNPPALIEVTDITIKTSPSKTNYLDGSNLELAGLVVTLTKSNKSNENVAFLDFESKGITVSMADGAALTIADVKVTIKHKASGKSVNQALTVTTIPVTDISISGDDMVGGTLKANITPEDARVIYQWMRSDTVDGEYEAISLATLESYELVDEDKGKFIKVSVTGIGAYSGTQTSDPVKIIYVLAKDDDFSGIGNRSFKYIGTDEYVVIPHIIKGINVDSYQYMFQNTSVKGVRSSNANITDMKHMFDKSQATTLDLSSFVTSGVTNINSMFRDSQATTLDLSSFNTSNVTNMSYMFWKSKATTLDLSSFNTSNVTNMSSMFYNSIITTLDLSNFDTSKVTDMGLMFCDSKATTLKLSSFNTSKVTVMNNMFRYSPATTLDLSSFDISKVTDMYLMFYGSKATTGYARTQTDADKFNGNSSKPAELTFVVPSISELALDSLVVAPVKAEMPNTTAIDATQYTGTISWYKPDGTTPVDENFEASKVYIAKVTLVAKEGFTLIGVAKDSFKYTGAKSVANEADSGLVTIAFAELEE